jgi:hypothetical protein
MALMADEEDVVILARKTHRLAVDFGDQRTRGIDGVQRAILGLLHHHG